MSGSAAPLVRGSALARPLDFSYPSNRVAAAGSAGAALLALAFGRPWAQAAGVGGAAFLAWATARELDPDHPVTANAALPVAAAVALLGGAGNPLAGLAVLSGLRLIAGTTGESATSADHAGLLLQSLLAGASGERAAALLVGAAPLLTPEAHSTLPAAGALIPTLARPAGFSWGSALLAVSVLPLARTLTMPEKVTSVCDRAERPVRAAEVQLARHAAVLTLGAGLLTRRTQGLVPLAAALLTVAARRAGSTP
ncbi:hypothetical protein GCM10008959_01950 [Deinococcus seoulensis]|uniref:Uncharacterized protein n=1 Tax=Deinococcus seoulensis TaxID=1837379 RepID=A0ABQ2RMS4_9DEIO|nr:hypothetical protein [Deinococcus seoulensis]GGR44532.1 hypothetical protein GCM10008959_01950 [Deinococcus seoulensis]